MLSLVKNLICGSLLFVMVALPIKVASAPADTYVLKKVDYKIHPYVLKFLASAKKNRIDLDQETLSFSVTFRNVKSEKHKDLVGYCFVNENAVGIDKAFWERSDELTRQTIVFHELGHCVLKRAHIMSQIEKMDALVPSSIMYPAVIGPTIVEFNQEYYEKELFSNQKEFGSLIKANRLGVKSSGLTESGHCENLD